MIMVLDGNGYFLNTGIPLIGGGGINRDGIAGEFIGNGGGIGSSIVF
jgi:hypothetical protein